MQKTQRMVIKVGSNVLINNQGLLSRDILLDIIGQIGKLHKENNSIVLVTSGAVAIGRERFSFKEIKEHAIRRQVQAAIGQIDLMSFYRDAFAKLNIPVAQALLIRDDFTNRLRFLNVQQTLLHCLEQGVLPIINENDVITTHESTFGDNDMLAAHTAITIDADRLLILTNIDGLYSADPQKDPHAKRIAFIENIDEEILAMASSGTSTLGIGGMLSKIHAAKIATRAGITTHIADGRSASTILRILAKEDVGTTCKPQVAEITNKQRWMISGKASDASIMIDHGAEKALKKRKSLLLVGVKKINGSFVENDLVQIVNIDQQLVGLGKVNAGSSDLSERLQKGDTKNVELIHANNFFIF